jgi:hypothetical protein
VAHLAQVRLVGEAVGLAHQLDVGLVQVVQLGGQRGEAGGGGVGGAAGRWGRQLATGSSSAARTGSWARI